MAVIITPRNTVEINVGRNKVNMFFKRKPTAELIQVNIKHNTIFFIYFLSNKFLFLSILRFNIEDINEREPIPIINA